MLINFKMKITDTFPAMTPELNVRDIKASLNFYTQLLGFKVCFERLEEGFATIERDGAFIMLEQVDIFDAPEEAWLTAELEYPYGRGVNFQIIVDDIDTIHRLILQHGYPIQLPLEQRSYRAGIQLINVRQFMIMDPDGYLLRLTTDTSSKL